MSRFNNTPIPTMSNNKSTKTTNTQYSYGNQNNQQYNSKTVETKKTYASLSAVKQQVKEVKKEEIKKLTFEIVKKNKHNVKKMNKTDIKNIFGELMYFEIEKILQEPDMKNKLVQNGCNNYRNILPKLTGMIVDYEYLTCGDVVENDELYSKRFIELYIERFIELYENKKMLKETVIDAIDFYNENKQDMSWE